MVRVHANLISNAARLSIFSSSRGIVMHVVGGYWRTSWLWWLQSILCAERRGILKVSTFVRKNATIEDIGLISFILDCT